MEEQDNSGIDLFAKFQICDFRFQYHKKSGFVVSEKMRVQSKNIVLM